MIAPPSRRASIYAASLIEDPLFRLGHDQAWRGMYPNATSSWDEVERAAYLSGFAFAKWLRAQGETRKPFSRGGVANSEVASLIIHWQCNDTTAVVA